MNTVKDWNSISILLDTIIFSYPLQWLAIFVHTSVAITANYVFHIFPLQLLTKRAYSPIPTWKQIGSVWYDNSNNINHTPIQWSSWPTNAVSWIRCRLPGMHPPMATARIRRANCVVASSQQLWLAHWDSIMVEEAGWCELHAVVPCITSSWLHQQISDIFFLCTSKYVWTVVKVDLKDDLAGWIHIDGY